MNVPHPMDYVLFPLALLGLFGEVLDLPAYLGGGWLQGFLNPLREAAAATHGHGSELALSAVAGVVALAGLAVAHYRYGGARRTERLAEAAAEPSRLSAFLLKGWRVDDLYRVLFIRPYEKLAGFLWEKVDEGVIDNGLDHLAVGLGKAGVGLGRWSTGRVSTYLLSLAAGAALLLGWLAWGLWTS